MKRAVIYYSLSGNTQEAAELIAKKLDADVIRIETYKPMPKNKGAQMLVCGMKSSFGMCPKIKELPEDVVKYDEIIIGTPIWASRSAAPINTLLSMPGMCEKIVGVFTSSGGGDNDKALAKLKSKLPNLRCDVALADRHNKSASDNEKKTICFAERI